ncbi:MAG: hypothetical protein CO127_09725 [Ignavibacteria bacterium CG_4_9_14_3_um_filter_36_18]|nr:four helix bundle protein [Ignavibacteria bacterium]PJA99898.1 MAG: hypothetical protein CO127_09725 [Ignavibacteria bacterium CG_4_9_14_3_um_filter_36_18]
MAVCSGRQVIGNIVSAHSHLDRAATSVALNISKGNGKYTNKDNCRYFDIARGYAPECASCLEYFS